MKNCKKCSAGAMRVHILGSGFCQECQSELEWKRGPHIVRQQKRDKIKNNHYKKGEEYIKRKWKEKYGNDDVDTVLGYK
tara:strand:- start:330 stop:566 length:237 start_codon:yes stop_codon:yes gene_type:complete